MRQARQLACRDTILRFLFVPWPSPSAPSSSKGRETIAAIRNAQAAVRSRTTPWICGRLLWQHQSTRSCIADAGPLLHPKSRWCWMGGYIGGGFWMFFWNVVL